MSKPVNTPTQQIRVLRKTIVIPHDEAKQIQAALDPNADPQTLAERTGHNINGILDNNSQHLLETLTPFINPLSHIKDLIQEVFFLHPTYKTPIECIHT